MPLQWLIRLIITNLSWNQLMLSLAWLSAAISRPVIPQFRFSLMSCTQLSNHTASIVNMPVNMQTTHGLWVQRYLRLMALNLRLPILDVQEASMSQSHLGTVLSDRMLARTAVTLTCTLHTPCTSTATWIKRQTCGGNTTVWDSGGMWSQRAASSNCIQ